MPGVPARPNPAGASGQEASSNPGAAQPSGGAFVTKRQATGPASAVGTIGVSVFKTSGAQGVVPAPLWIPQLGYCLGLVLLAIAFVDELVHVIRGNKPRYEKEPPKTAEEVIERAASSAV